MKKICRYLIIILIMSLFISCTVLSAFAITEPSGDTTTAPATSETVESDDGFSNVPQNGANPDAATTTPTETTVPQQTEATQPEETDGMKPVGPMPDDEAQGENPSEDVPKTEEPKSENMGEILFLTVYAIAGLFVFIAAFFLHTAVDEILRKK